MSTLTDRSASTPTGGSDRTGEPGPSRPEQRTTRRAPWALVAAREIAVKLRDRNFLVGTALTLVLLVGAMLLPQLFTGGSSSYEVAVTDADGAAVVEQAQTALQLEEPEGTVAATTVPDRGSAEAQVRDGEVDAALVRGDAGWEMVTDGEPSTTLTTLLTDTVRSSAMEQNAAAAGTTVEELTAGTTLTPVDLSEAEGGMPSFVKFILGFVFAFLFYMTSIMFGYQIANSVVEEKANRIVEILAAKIPVRQLLLGKVLGNTAIAFGQIALIAAVSLIGLTFIDLDVALPGLTQAIAWYVPFFVLGFLALACVWAASGALASRTEDVQSTSMPLTMVLVILFIASINVEGQVREILSFVPLASTFLMPMRIIEGGTELWEPVLALVLVLAFSGLTIWLGARLYERALLHTSGSLTWRKAMALRDD